MALHRYGDFRVEVFYFDSPCILNLQHSRDYGVDDDLDVAFVCTMISATSLPSLYAELSKYCAKRKRRVRINLGNCVTQARLYRRQRP